MPPLTEDSIDFIMNPGESCPRYYKLWVISSFIFPCSDPDRTTTVQINIQRVNSFSNVWYLLFSCGSYMSIKMLRNRRDRISFWRYQPPLLDRSQIFSVCSTHEWFIMLNLIQLNVIGYSLYCPDIDSYGPFFRFTFHVHTPSVPSPCLKNIYEMDGKDNHLRSQPI